MSEEYINQNDETQQQQDTSTDNTSNQTLDKTDAELEAMNDEDFMNYLNTQVSISKNSSDTKEQPSEPTTEANRENSTETSDSDQKVSESASSGVKQPPTETQTTETADQDNFDYKSALQMIMQPFKANGKEVQPRTLEDVISLMQMGANYTKKMQAIAPMRKTVETLNNANISNDDLNFLIDIHKGDKEAIKQLLKKNNIEPSELDLEELNYQPSDKSASDSDIAFKEVVEDFKEYVPKIQDIITNKWDSQSRQAIFKDTRFLRGLGEEIAMGRFDAIQTVLEREKQMGRYRGVSDLEAYIDIASKYDAYLQQKSQQQYQQQMQYQQQQIQQQQQQQYKETKSKASPNKSINNNKPSKMTAEQMAMLSDEEFEKLSIKDII